MLGMNHGSYCLPLQRRDRPGSRLSPWRAVEMQAVELQPVLRLQQPGIDGRHVDLPAMFTKNMSSLSAIVPMAADQKPSLGNGSWLVQVSLNGGHDLFVASNDTDSVNLRLSTFLCLCCALEPA